MYILTDNANDQKRYSILTIYLSLRKKGSREIGIFHFPRRFILDLVLRGETEETLDDIECGDLTLLVKLLSLAIPEILITLLQSSLTPFGVLHLPCLAFPVDVEEQGVLFRAGCEGEAEANIDVALFNLAGNGNRLCLIGY